MKTAITQQQIEDYQDQGFLVVEDFLSPDELAELKSAVLKTVKELGDKKVAGGEVEMTDGNDYYAKVFTQKLNLWRINETVRRYMLDPGLGEAVSKLSGVDGMRVWHDQALIKQPWGNPTAWHLDAPYWAFHSRQTISIWIALEDATLQNGCLFFLPGTHKEATFENVTIGQNFGGLFTVYPQWAEREPACAAMKAGTASFHNGLTAHGAGPNITPHTRAAMTCAFMPNGATFNGQQNILPDRVFNSLKVGDVLADDERNPLVYSTRENA